MGPASDIQHLARHLLDKGVVVPSGPPSETHVIATNPGAEFIPGGGLELYLPMEAEASNSKRSELTHKLLSGKKPEGRAGNAGKEAKRARATLSRVLHNFLEAMRKIRAGMDGPYILTDSAIIISNRSQCWHLDVPHHVYQVIGHLTDGPSTEVALAPPPMDVNEVLTLMGYKDGAAAAKKFRADRDFLGQYLGSCHVCHSTALHTPHLHAPKLTGPNPLCVLPGTASTTNRAGCVEARCPSRDSEHD